MLDMFTPHVRPENRHETVSGFVETPSITRTLGEEGQFITKIEKRTETFRVTYDIDDPETYIMEYVERIDHVHTEIDHVHE